MARIIPTRAPNLPLAADQYTPRGQEQFSNALRLYFRKIDEISSAVLGPLGTQFFNSPHIGAASNVDQYAAGDDTPTQVLFDTRLASAGFMVEPDSTTIAPVSATYKLDYSLQFKNTDQEQHDVFVWLQVNGDLATDSSSRFTVPARKSLGVHGFLIGYSSIVFPAKGGDVIRMWWATEKAATSGGVAGVFMPHLPAQTTPYPRPGNPSAVASIFFLSCPCDTAI